MPINDVFVDAEIERLTEDDHSACFTAAMVARDARGIDSIERAVKTADFYKGSGNLSYLACLVLIQTLLDRPADGEAWATAALGRMDHTLRMQVMGLCVSKDDALRLTNAKSEQDDIDESSRDVGA
jgi:hypothetical protein